MEISSTSQGKSQFLRAWYFLGNVFLYIPIQSLTEIHLRDRVSLFLVHIFQDINPEALCYGILELVALCYGILALLNDESCYILSSYISSVFIKWRVANINLAAGNVLLVQRSHKIIFNHTIFKLELIHNCKNKRALSSLTLQAVYEYNMYFWSFKPEYGIKLFLLFLQNKSRFGISTKQVNQQAICCHVLV